MTKKSAEHPRRCGSQYTQPPRFSRTATEILGHPPYYLPTSKYQYEPQILTQQIYSQLLAGQIPAALCPETVDRGTPLALPTPTQFMSQFYHAALTSVPTQWVTPSTNYLDHNFSPYDHLSTFNHAPPPVPPSDMNARPDGIHHPAPRRPILLPGIRGPLLHRPHPANPAIHLPVSKTVRPPQQNHIDPSDYNFNVNAIFREDSRFLPLTTVSNLPPPAPHSRSPTFESGHHRKKASPDALLDMDQSVHPNLQIIVTQVRQRFSCFIDCRWLERIVVPGADWIPSIFFTPRGKAYYQKTVRSWVMTNTGITIYRVIKEALADKYFCEKGRCKMSYVWLVLLVREILVLSPYAQDLGALVRLGARDLDPCDPSFRFLPLQKAVRELIEAMNFGPTSDIYVLQQRVQGRCSRGHIHISLAETPFSALYSRPGPRYTQDPDKVAYTNALRDTLLKLLNDGCNLDYLFLAECCRLDSGNGANI